MKRRLYIILLVLGAGLVSAVGIKHRAAIQDEPVCCKQQSNCPDAQSKNEQSGIDRIEFSPIKQIIEGI